MRWLACELHTHTFHSDGRQSLLELAEGARSLGFDCVALTDHNTMTGLRDAAEVEGSTGLTVIPGMEWTTFHGHMVTLGLNDFVDWRKAEPANIHEGIAGVHRYGGLAGMAHPYRIGSPVCTGCFWEFEIRDWNDIDYIEVWSGTFPSIKNTNARAFALWTDRLNAGFRIAATSGRDWHVQDSTDEPVAVTYLGVADAEEGNLAGQAIAALARGRASVTIGPLVNLEIAMFDGGRYGIGDVVPAGINAAPEICEARIRKDFTVRQGLWSIPEQTFTLRLTGSTGVLGELNVGREDEIHTLSISRSGLRWVRAELWGVVRGVRTLIAFTNAIFFDNDLKEVKTR